jgi:molybdate transport system substrate-binding protein
VRYANDKNPAHKLAITFTTVGAIVKRVQSGETADVVIIPREGIDGFVKDGKTATGNVTVVARSGIGVAVREGAPKPDISSHEALKSSCNPAANFGRSGIIFNRRQFVSAGESHA